MHTTTEIPMVSVVIPIYKVERYLAQCVESVLTQTMCDIEVILVDDGSPDACPQIADEFAARDSRVTVIHQLNQGLSGARNAGLARASGEFVVFLDSDDFWEGKDCLARCVEAFENRPELMVLVFDALRFYESTNERVFGDVVWDSAQVADSSNVEIMRYMVECEDVRPSACTKMIRRDFLVRNRLDFKSGIFSEDVEWFLRLITHPAKYRYLPLAFYMYRKNRSGSITNTIGTRNVANVLSTVTAAGLRMLESEAPEQFQRDYLSYCCYQFTIALAFYGGLTQADRRALRPQVDAARFLLAYDGYRHSKSIARLVKILGLGNTASLLHAYLVLRSRRNRGH